MGMAGPKSMHTRVIAINNRQGSPYNLFKVTGFCEKNVGMQLVCYLSLQPLYAYFLVLPSLLTSTVSYISLYQALNVPMIMLAKVTKPWCYKEHGN